MLKRFLAVVLVSLLVATPALAESIPFVRTDSLMPEVEYVLNGTTYKGVIDTGATGILLGESVVKDQYAKGRLSEANIVGFQSTTLADGKEVVTLVYKIKSFKFGHHEYRDKVFYYIPGSDMTLLGEVVVTQYEYFTINNAKSTIELPH